MWIELKSIVGRASDDTDVRVIVLSSSFDKYFTAGLDCKSIFGQDWPIVTAQTTLNDTRNLDAARKAFVLHQHLIVRAIGLPIVRSVPLKLCTGFSICHIFSEYMSTTGNSSSVWYLTRSCYRYSFSLWYTVGSIRFYLWHSGGFTCSWYSVLSRCMVLVMGLGSPVTD